eukprot:4378924-Pleurochrysis_carterae.AAC.4
MRGSKATGRVRCMCERGHACGGELAPARRARARGRCTALARPPSRPTPLRHPGRRWGRRKKYRVERWGWEGYGNKREGRPWVMEAGKQASRDGRRRMPSRPVSLNKLSDPENTPERPQLASVARRPGEYAAHGNALRCTRTLQYPLSPFSNAPHPICSEQLPCRARTRAP